MRGSVTQTSKITLEHSQLENELPEVALRRFLRHDVAHLLAHRSDLRRLRVTSLLDLVVLLLGEADASLKCDAAHPRDKHGRGFNQTLNAGHQPFTAKK